MSTHETTMTSETSETDRPLQAVLESAIAAHADAETAYNECECDMPAGEHCVHYHAMRAADAAFDAARDALRDSDEPRDWILCEEGYDYETVESPSAEEALEEARSNVDRSNYPDLEGTIWIDVSVRCKETGEEDSDTVACEAEEPECTSDATEHNWQSPHDIVGGIEENPGVWGHGGGVIILEVCIQCGCERTTDTWAQNPETGEQGLTSVSYEPGKYAEEVAAAQALKEVEAAGCVRAQCAAAEVLAFCRDENCDVTAQEQDRKRVGEVIAFLWRVRRVGREERALRLALRCAAKTEDERRIAEVVIARLA